MKNCNICNVEKPESDFPRRDKKSLKGFCKMCDSNKRKIKRKTNKKALTEDQIEKARVQRKEYLANRTDEQIKKDRQIYKAKYEKNKVKISLQNRERKNQYQRTYYKEHKQEIFEKEKQKYKNDVQFRLSKIYRNRMNSYIKGEKDNMKYLQASLDTFKVYIESQYQDGMSWDNQGNIWELDHILPVSKFNLESLEHKQVCFHWCNYQPILKSDNKKKHSKIYENVIQEQSVIGESFSKLYELNYCNIHAFYETNKKNFQ